MWSNYIVYYTRRDPSTSITAETVSMSYQRLLYQDDPADLAAMKNLAKMINPYRSHDQKENAWGGGTYYLLYTL